jgi:hypothetical protein
MRSQLHLAVLLCRVPDVRALLKSKVNLDLVDDGAAWTPLMYAAASGEEEIVKILLSAGADVKVRGRNGVTAADAARRNGWGHIASWVEAAAELGLDERRDKFGEAKGGEIGPEGDGPDMWIWIDQLCINQGDIEERGRQVSMMGEIYSGAFWTLVWLGAEDGHTTTAIQAVQKLSDAEGDLTNSRIVPYVDQAEEIYAAANVPYISSAEWKALASLFQRQYFRRIWVVQENLLSQITLGLCGDNELPWRQLCTVAQQLYLRQLAIGHPTSAMYIHHAEAAVQIEFRATQLVQWKDRWLNGAQAANPKTCNLGALVGDCWTFHATNPRDKIFGFYGLLNLLRDHTDQDSRLVAGGNESKSQKTTTAVTAVPMNTWVADYTKSTAQVFAEATKTMIKEAGNLAVLANVIDTSCKETVSLPSWSPDFSVPFTNALPGRYCASGRKRVREPAPFLYSSIRWTHLPVLVRPLDIILQVDPNTTSGPGDTMVFFSRAWVSLSLLLPTPYHDTGLSRTEVLWRTLTADTSLAGTRPAPKSYGSAFRDLVSAMVCIAAREEMQQFAKLEFEGTELRFPECPAPSLEAAIEHVKATWQNPALKSLDKEELTREFGEVGRNLSGERWEALVFGLMGLHVLALTECDCEVDDDGKGQGQTGSSLFTPSLDQLLDFNKRMDRDRQDGRESTGVKLLPNVTDLSHALRRTLGRRRLFVTQGRFLGIGPAGMRKDDQVMLIGGFDSPVVLRKLEDSNRDAARRDFVEKRDDAKANQPQEARGHMTEKLLEKEHVESVGHNREQWNFVGQAFVFGFMDGEGTNADGEWKQADLV